MPLISTVCDAVLYSSMNLGLLPSSSFSLMALKSMVSSGCWSLLFAPFTVLPTGGTTTSPHSGSSSVLHPASDSTARHIVAIYNVFLFMIFIFLFYVANNQNEISVLNWNTLKSIPSGRAVLSGLPPAVICPLESAYLSLFMNV